MAEKRMISKQIIDSDTFLDMPLSAQALYFHLLMRADDDGFVDNSKKIVRMICASEDDLKLLIAKRYLLVFETGVVVVKHWRVHNYIKNDRYIKTSHIDEYAMLDLLPNREYKIKENCPQVYPQDFTQAEIMENNESYPQDNAQCFQQTYPQNNQNRFQSGSKVVPSRFQSDSETTPEWNHRLDKIRLDKISIDEDRADETTADAESSSSDIIINDDITKKVVDEYSRLLPALNQADITDRLKKLIHDAGKPVEYYTRVFETAAKSRYLSSTHDGGWSCSLEWLCKPENAEKVLSGKYADFDKAKTVKADAARQGVEVVNGVESGFDTESAFEAALRRGMAKAGTDVDMDKVISDMRGE